MLRVLLCGVDLVWDPCRCNPGNKGRCWRLNMLYTSIGSPSAAGGSLVRLRQRWQRSVCHRFEPSPLRKKQEAGDGGGRTRRVMEGEEQEEGRGEEGWVSREAK